MYIRHQYRAHACRNAAASWWRKRHAFAYVCATTRRHDAVTSTLLSLHGSCLLRLVLRYLGTAKLAAGAPQHKRCTVYAASYRRGLLRTRAITVRGIRCG